MSSASEVAARGVVGSVDVRPSSRTGGRPPRRGGRRRVPVAVPWTFVAPSLLLFVVFAFGPIIVSVVLSFQDVQTFGGGSWIGGKNYADIPSDPVFWTSVWNTVVFTLGTVPTSAAIGLLLAVLLNRRLPGRGVIRSLYFLPMVVSGVAVSLVMAWIFNADNGIANAALQALGLPRITWLSSPHWAMATVILTVVWGRIGFCMVTYLAALQNINPSVLEAASVDGAGSGKRFSNIVWPLLRPTTYILVVLNVVFSIQAFDVIYVLTGGGPGFSTTVLVQYIFRAAFTQGTMGYASAVGVLLVLTLLLLTLVRNVLARRTEEDQA
ncbi:MULTISPECIES: sugar ABC transporter permease [unclassified Curtobacterium]|uniref:carbohydrate ABC transporter permease n=1 Tax=unclassified Curtobacterium TaxID=257496 RepID=UPI0021AD4567|nr:MULTISPECIES: sugar ABC transporter permease [unclassified Curtobacterium]WIB64937.1 sugar ABC transporter permease [Curtobacterium sp. MCBD17_040]WIB68775.1 sugar ABC transporter permease [Curtobacterium sp. MCBD17_035]WIE55960.1 sugar ABC transporter permease [Curtobacterium sp. MCBD17_003]